MRGPAWASSVAGMDALHRVGDRARPFLGRPATWHPIGRELSTGAMMRFDELARVSRWRHRRKPHVPRLSSLASAFARHSINIDAILQEPGFPVGRRPFVVSLEPSPVSSIERAMKDLSAFEFHGEAPVALPVLSVVSTGVPA